MAGWISSKLKVAESFLQQIDQQAAESLGKGEKPLNHTSSEVWRDESSGRRADSPPPIKHQLPKRTPTPPLAQSPSPETNPSPSARRSNGLSVSSAAPSADPAAVVDADWTQLLSSSKPFGPGPPRPLGSPAKLPSRRDHRRSNISSGDTSFRPAPPSSSRPAVPSEVLPSKQSSSLTPQSQGEGSTAPTITTGATTAAAGWEDVPMVSNERDGAVAEIVVDTSFIEPDQPLRNSGTDDDDASGSETDLGSTSDSEEEIRRDAKRRMKERRAALKAAAAAVESIKERESHVAKLEGEIDSLKKIIDEREKQQAQEAEELQVCMIENMEAVDIEKQKHNATRMEALARLAKLEAVNAELTTSLATTQRNLEVESNHTAELRQQIELKELAQKEYRRKLLEIHDKNPSTNGVESSRKDELERELFDAEQTYICDKIAKLEKKSKNLQENIGIAKAEMANPSELEVELKRRLVQLTDHLIQKQSEVEALCSDKAMAQLRIEAFARSQSENDPAYSPSLRIDIDPATAEGFSASTKLGKQKLGAGPDLRHVVSVLSLGAVYLKRNPAARTLALAYFLCLHLWVVYILMSPHPHPHPEATVSGSHGGSGAALSLDGINRTSAATL